MLDRTVAYGLEFAFPAGDDAIGESLACHGEFARPITEFLLEHAVEPGGSLVDVGANIGAIALPFAALKPRWRVVAVEAHRGLASILSANAINNRLANCQVIQAAAGARAGVVDFPNVPLDSRGNFGVMGVGRSDQPLEPTLMVTLDQIAPPDTRLVKIDVEGFDAEVLKGATRLLAETRPVLMVEAAADANALEVKRLLLEAGYRLFWFYAPFVTPKAPKRRKPPDYARGDANVVALPPGRETSWTMPRIVRPDDPRPPEAADYAYLDRYGLR